MRSASSLSDSDSSWFSLRSWQFFSCIWLILSITTWRLRTYLDTFWWAWGLASDSDYLDSLQSWSFDGRRALDAQTTMIRYTLCCIHVSKSTKLVKVFLLSSNANMVDGFSDSLAVQMFVVIKKCRNLKIVVIFIIIFVI